MLYSHKSDYSESRSKAFLLGLYVGLSLLLFVVLCFSVEPRNSHLRIATNIYGIQTLAGAVLGYWRIRKKARKPKALPALCSAGICLGLALWTIGQALWTWVGFRQLTGPGFDYPGYSDIFYMSSNLAWLLALVMLYRALRRRSIIETSPYTKALIPIGISLVLTGIPKWINPDKFPASELLVNFGYILLTFSGLILAIGLLLGENSRLPAPVHQCIRYLSFATAIDAIGIFAFTVTAQTSYYNGNLVDWLFLSAMYCWGVSALMCPINQEDLEYTFHTSRSRVRAEDIYQASALTREYSETSPLVDSESINWIQDKIPGCWRVVKLGDLVVGSTFLFPVPQDVMKSFHNAPTKEMDPGEQEALERKLFETVRSKEQSGEPIRWDCLYLADASTLTAHRRRGLAFDSFRTTIDKISSEHRELNIEVYCWSNSPERTKLAEKLEKHFAKTGITVINRD